MPDVRQILSVIHSDHVVNFNLAMDMTRQLQPDIYGSAGDQSRKHEGTATPRGEEGDFDSNDSINDRVMISDREWDDVPKDKKDANSRTSPPKSGKKIADPKSTAEEKKTQNSLTKFISGSKRIDQLLQPNGSAQKRTNGRNKTNN